MWRTLAGMAQQIPVHEMRFQFSHRPFGARHGRMSKLQNWMRRNDMDDAAVAVHCKISRSQINRIRREKTAASYSTAVQLEKLTGIRWWHFMAVKQEQP